MKTPSKSELLKQNAELRHERDLYESYLNHVCRGEVTFIEKGSTRLGICGETRASGGIVAEFARDESGRAVSVVGVYYWESRFPYVREYPVAGNDVERQDWRACYYAAQKHVAKKQHEFYAPKIAESLAIA